jgi:hypothetical protein
MVQRYNDVSSAFQISILCLRLHKLDNIFEQSYHKQITETIEHKYQHALCLSFKNESASCTYISKTIRLNVPE